MYSFENIVGNKQIIKNLKNSIINNKVSHAYIFNGSNGVGKKLLAKTFAKSLQCTGHGNIPCGQCDSCRVFESGNHPDIFYIKATKTKAISVDDIREQVIENVSVKQYKYKYKIFIIDKSDTMTVQAQNSLLKTLEEPPSYAVFLLISKNIDLFLPTILSRCVTLKIRELSVGQIRDFLVSNTGIEKDTADIFAEYAEGSIGHGLEIIGSEHFTKMRESVIKWVSNIHRLDMVSVMDISKEMETYKENKEFLDIMMLWYRDVLAFKKLKDIKYIIQKDKINLISEQAVKETFQGLLKKINAVWNAKIQLGQNANFQLALEIMLIKIKES